MLITLHAMRLMAVIRGRRFRSNQSRISKRRTTKIDASVFSPQTRDNTRQKKSTNKIAWGSLL